jgi:diguanylate cyclase (GGDEF)-like protein
MVVAILASISFLWLMLLNFHPGPGTIITLITLLVVLNIMGGMTAYRISRLQHESYLDASVLQEANAALQREVAQRETLEDDLRKLLERDPLTGLPNRAHFFPTAIELIGAAELNARPLSFLIVDIDYFRQINGAFGHIRGDEVLQTLAERCRRQLPEGALCARLGGDDFAVLLPGVDLGAALAFANELRRDIKRDSVDLGDSGLRFTVSMGAAQWYAGENINSLLRRADQALSAAKYNGRDCVEEAPEAKPSGGVEWS